MPNTNNCRLLVQDFNALACVPASDAFRVTYSGFGGLTLNIRSRYIGGDPHNRSLYEKLGWTPSQAFTHAENILGYRPTNRNTAGVKAAIRDGAWGENTQTPHWKEGDGAGALRLLMSLVSGNTCQNIPTPVPVNPDAEIEAFIASYNLPSSAVLLSTLKALLRYWKSNYRLRNFVNANGDGGMIAGLSFNRASRYLISSSGNESLFKCAGLDRAGVNMLAQGLSGIRPINGSGFPETDATGTKLLAYALAAKAKSMPLGGILYVTSAPGTDAVITTMVADANGRFYVAGSAKPDCIRSQEVIVSSNSLPAWPA